MFQNWEGALNYAVDVDQISTAEYWNTKDTQPSFIVKGFRQFSRNTKQQFSYRSQHKVLNIDCSGSGVKVITSKDQF